MKLMLVGYAARGKTTLLQKITEKGKRGVQENWSLRKYVLFQQHLLWIRDLYQLCLVLESWRVVDLIRTNSLMSQLLELW